MLKHMALLRIYKVPLDQMDGIDAELKKNNSKNWFAIDGR